MAAPLNTKPSVNLASSGVRVSRIRRDPPPIVKQSEIRDRREIDRRNAFIGILTFAAAIVVIVLAFGHWAGWSPGQYTVAVGEPR